MTKFICKCAPGGNVGTIVYCAMGVHFLCLTVVSLWGGGGVAKQLGSPPYISLASHTLRTKEKKAEGSGVHTAICLLGMQLLTPWPSHKPLAL